MTVEDVVAILGGKRGKIAILCGAGISVASGLPTASAMLEHILTALGIDAHDVSELRRPDGTWRMPFESFMEAFVEHDQNTTLFDIFLLGEPNRNHLLIKKLTSEGTLAEICTTNFDLLVERMFAAAPTLPLQVVLEDASEVALSTTSAQTLIKLHGTASNKATIRSTILSISSGHGFEARTRLVRRVLESATAALWVWGYSCSDVLDINPAIAEAAGTKTVVLLNHDPAAVELSRAEVSSLADLPEDNPFRKYTGYSIRIHSDTLVAKLLGRDTVSRDGAAGEVEWRAVIARWVDSLAFSHIGFSILCHLFYNLASFDLALKYNTEAIRANRGADQRGEGAALSNRGMILFRLGRNAEALAAFRDALARFEAIGFQFGVATSHNNIGYVSAHVGRIEEGHKHLARGLETVAAGDFREARLCEGYLVKSRGELKVREGRLAAAEEDYDKAAAIFRDGYLAELAEVTMLKGKLYRAMGKSTDGEELLKKAIALASKVGNAEVVLEGNKLLADE